MNVHQCVVPNCSADGRLSCYKCSALLCNWHILLTCEEHSKPQRNTPRLCAVRGCAKQLYEPCHLCEAPLCYEHSLTECDQHKAAQRTPSFLCVVPGCLGCASMERCSKCHEDLCDEHKHLSCEQHCKPQGRTVRPVRNAARDANSRIKANNLENPLDLPQKLGERTITVCMPSVVRPDPELLNVMMQIGMKSPRVYDWSKWFYTAPDNYGGLCVYAKRTLAPLTLIPFAGFPRINGLLFQAVVYRSVLDRTCTKALQIGLKWARQRPACPSAVKQGQSTFLLMASGAWELP